MDERDGSGPTRRAVRRARSANTGPRRRDEFGPLGWTAPAAMTLLGIETVAGAMTTLLSATGIVLGAVAYHAAQEPPAEPTAPAHG